MPKSKDRRRLEIRNRIKLISRWRTKRGKQARAEILAALQTKEMPPAESIAKLRGRKSLQSVIDLQCVNLAGENLDAVELSGARLQGANLARCSLMGANLAGADLRDVLLRNTDLSGANLEKANFDGAVLENTKIDGAIMAGAIFTGRTIVVGTTKLSSEIIIRGPSDWAEHNIKDQSRGK